MMLLMVTEFSHPSLDMLGPYPILQFGAAAIVLLMTAVGALAWFRGEKWGRATAAAAGIGAPVAELHFDGPLKDIFAKLGDIRAHQLLVRLEIKDDFAILLSQSRHGIIDKLAIVQEDVNDTIVDAVRNHEAAMENRFRDLQGNINSVHTRLDSILQSLARLEPDPPPQRGRR